MNSRAEAAARGPVLDVDHIQDLGRGGEDDPRNMVALCPNCHRRVHFGGDGTPYNDELAARMRQIEPATD